MSINIPTVAEKEFISDLHHEYRSMGFLTKGLVRTKTNVVGRTAQFPVINQGLAQTKAIQDKVIPMNVEYQAKVITLENWHAAEYTDIFFESDVSWDDRSELVTICTQAIGRRMDQLVIDALAAGATQTVGTYATGFTWALFTQAFETLRDNGAAGTEMYGLMSASAERQFLGETEVTSSDFVNYQPIAGTGFHMREIMGVKFVVIPSMSEGGLPLATANRDIYIFNKNAVGFASGMDLRVNTGYVDETMSWLVTAASKAGATVIDPRGVVELRILDTA